MLSAKDFKRLQWHSRRGMVELDVLLEPFTKQIFKTLSEEDQRGYRRLLDCEDPDLLNWFISDERPQDTELTKIVNAVLKYARGTGADGTCS